MEGISKDELIEVRKSLAAEGLNTDTIDALITLKVKELQEPWMTLEEFLMSGFEGWCWIIEKDDNQPSLARYNNDDMFVGTSGFIVFDEHNITHVIPIHKPEPPK